MYNNCGIYQIINIIDNKRYIGSSCGLQSRIKCHSKSLSQNKHYNKYLQNAYNKQGNNNFKFEILLYCDKKDLIFFEQRAIDSYKIKNLYNGRPKAENFLGYKQSEEHIKKRIKCGDDHYLKTHPYSEERKIKQRNALKGKKRPIECIRRIANSQRGRLRLSVSKEKNPSYIKTNDKLIIDLHKDGKTNKEISFIMGVSVRVVQIRMIWYGLKSNRSNQKYEIDIKKIHTLRKNNLYYYEIAKLMGVSESVISRNYRNSKFYKGKKYGKRKTNSHG